MNTSASPSTNGGATKTPRYGMVVDLNRCVGCQTCTIACKHHNDTPPGVQWRRVLDVEEGEYPNVQRLFLVTGCQHCADPPCVPVCPTGATKQREDGLVTMDYDTCIGCGYCAVACPYQARTIVHDKSWYFGAPTRQETHVQHDERQGVANKCTFCIDKVDAAKEAGAVPGLDLEYTPACASSCIAQALHFGDFSDPDSNVSRLAAENAHFQMHEELGTDPQIRYLYEVPQTTPGRDAASQADAQAAADARELDPGNPLRGERQTFWDFRAAMNFILGGAGSGLAVSAAVAWLAGGISERVVPSLFFAAACLVGIGLLFVFAEIGRKARFLYVLRRPQSSWMTRETWVVAVFFPAVGADLLWPSPALHILVGLSGAAFLFCQGRILHAGKGIPAWRNRRIPWMLMKSGLLEGTALTAALAPLASMALVGAAPAGFPGGSGRLLPLAPGFALVGCLLVFANAGLWHAYRRAAAADGIGFRARYHIDAITPILRWGGHFLPALCFIVATLPIGPAPYAVLLGAVAAIMGGALWKFTIIVNASYQQGFALPRLPQRGSGSRAAPARLGLTPG